MVRTNPAFASFDIAKDTGLRQLEASQVFNERFPAYLANLLDLGEDAKQLDQYASFEKSIPAYAEYFRTLREQKARALFDGIDGKMLSKAIAAQKDATKKTQLQLIQSNWGALRAWLFGVTVRDAQEKKDKRAVGMIPLREDVLKMFLDTGWAWGGDWQKEKDYMHFEDRQALARTLGHNGDIWLPEDWLPDDADIQVTSSEFADLDPPEYRADVVLRVTPHTRDDSDANDRDRATREVFIVEVQLDPDQVKHFTWPQYVTAARTRFRCPATLVVVAVDERVARWCAQPITLDRAGNVFRPVVIGPAAIPVVTDEAEARIWPELAVLSVIAHGHETGSEVIGAAALAACDRLDSAQARLYADLIYNNLNEIARAALEALMQQHNYTYQSDFAKKYFSQGIEEGRKEGRKEGYGELLREQLLQRFGELPADVMARLDEAEADTLRAWGRRVLTAGSLADVFASEPG